MGSRGWRGRGLAGRLPGTRGRPSRRAGTRRDGELTRREPALDRGQLFDSVRFGFDGIGILQEAIAIDELVNGYG